MATRNADVGVVHTDDQSRRHIHWMIGLWTIISWQERRLVKMIILWLIHGHIWIWLSGGR